MNAVNGVADPLKELNESLKELQTKDPSIVHDNMTVQDVAEADDQVITSAPWFTNESILEEVSAMDEEDETNNLANDRDDVDEEEKSSISREVERSLETLKNYSLLSKNRWSQMMVIIFNFENLVIVEKSKNYLEFKLSYYLELPSIPNFRSVSWEFEIPGQYCIAKSK